LKQLTRFEIDGVRHYRTGDRPDRAYPSVTAILGKTASARSKQTLEQWNLRNPGGKEAAAKRGSIIHKACEDHLRGKAVDVPADLAPYWDGLAPHLDAYDYFTWSEKPLRPDWSFCTGDDGISRIWSHKHRFCGCPDIVGVRGGIVVLADVKSSSGRYCRYFPKGEENGVAREHYGGWMKFNKCALQLGAYAIAFEETLGISVEMAQILVTTPDATQSFLLRGHELHSWRYKWLQRVADYYRLVALEQELAALPSAKASEVKTPSSMGEKLLIAA
jgi:hypothetical protein